MGTMRLLEADPDLAVLLPPDRRADAMSRFEVEERLVERGRASPAGLSRPAEGVVALMVIDGAVGLTVSLGERQHLELLGPGDVAQPWMHLTEPGALRPTLAWRVVVHSRLAWLGPGFVRDAADHPEVLTLVLHRLVLRARRADLVTAVASFPRVRDRVLMILWHLADRWGRVTPEGVRVELPLSHQDLADLIAVRRPSVTDSLSELTDVVDRRDRLWLLKGTPPAELDELRRRLGLPEDDEPRRNGRGS